MAITQGGDGSIVALPINDGIVTAHTGVYRADSFAIRANTDFLKQIQFDPSAQADNTVVTLASSPATNVNITYTLPSYGGSLGPADPAMGTVLYDDFLSSSINGCLNWATFGTSTVTTAVSDSTHVGVAYVGTSTSTSGYGGLYVENAILFGSCTLIYETLVRLSALSTDSQAYTFRAGLGDSYDGASDFTNGVYFEYTHTENGGNWTCKTSDNSTQTVANSGVAAAASTWVKLKFVVTGSNKAQFYINGNLVATTTTNIPHTSNHYSGPEFLVVKSAGTTAVYCYIDYIYMNIQFTVIR